MPTNLPPQCLLLQQKYFEAQTLPQKIKALEEYYSAIPKHKGTEKLCSQVKRTLSKLKLELEEKKRRRIATSLSSGRYAIKKEGAAQVVILGSTGSGKSSLLRALTNARPEIGSHPFTTTAPIPGMMPFEDVQIQLVEAPALFQDASKGKGWGARSLSLARNADGVILLVNLAAPHPSSQLKMMMDELHGARIEVEEDSSPIEIERKDRGGIHFICLDGSVRATDEIKQFLVENGVFNAIVRIQGEVELDDVAASLVSGLVYKSAIVVANKLDVVGSATKLQELVRFSSKLRVFGVSAKTRMGLEELSRSIFEALNLIRIYTKKPKQTRSKRPMIVKRDTTVEDIAKDVHSEYFKHFKYAKVWGSTKFPGERVGLKYLLHDGDVVELHT